MVKIEHITYAYRRGAGNVLEDVGFDIRPGEVVAILGNNGAGKSTLLKCIDRIHPVTGGKVTIDGENVLEMSGTALARRVAYVPQNAGAMQMTVFDAVLLGRKPYIRWDATARDRQMASGIIHQMGLDAYILRNVSELSGGEAQKVMMARALVQEPRLLLLDEPTSNLDPRNQHDVMALIREEVRKRAICAAIVIHDLNLAVRYCDKFLFLKNSSVYSYGGMESMTPETIESVYHMPVQIVRCGAVPVIVPCPREAADAAAQ